MIATKIDRPELLADPFRCRDHAGEIRSRELAAMTGNALRALWWWSAFLRDRAA